MDKCLLCGLEIGRPLSIGQIEAVIHQLARPSEDDDPRLNRLCTACRGLHVSLREQQQARQRLSASLRLLALSDCALGEWLREFFYSCLETLPAETLGQFARATMVGDSIKMAEAVKAIAVPRELLTVLAGGRERPEYE
jgi:hypothetical protein